MTFEVILGIGTLILLSFQLWILWKQTKIINLQKEVAKDQSLYLMRKEDPLIEFQRKEYNGDKITLYLFNSGGTRAVGVALKTEVYIVKPLIKEENGKIWISSRGDWDMEKQLNFMDGKEKYSLGSSIVEIFHDKIDYPELELNQSHKFVQEVSFGLYSKKENFPGPQRPVTFKQLVGLLKKNKVLGCEIKISLIYKNLSNKIVEEIPLDKFYIIPPNIIPKFLSELTEEEKLNGGMSLIPIHPFFKGEHRTLKSEETYRELNHCER
jgi:hypothetical protein